MAAVYKKAGIDVGLPKNNLMPGEELRTIFVPRSCGPVWTENLTSEVKHMNKAWIEKLSVMHGWWIVV